MSSACSMQAGFRPLEPQWLMVPVIDPAGLSASVRLLFDDPQGFMYGIVTMVRHIEASKVTRLYRLYLLW